MPETEEKPAETTEHPLGKSEMTFSEFKKAREGVEKPEQEKPGLEEKPEEKAAPEEKPAEEEKPPAEGKSEEPAKEEKKGGWQKRIDKLTERNYQLQAERAELIATVQRLQGQPAEARRPAPTAKARPKPEDFKDYDAYIEGVADWKSEQKINQYRRQEAVAAQNAELQETFENYSKKLGKFREQHDDFDEVVGESDSILIPRAAQVAIISLENGPEIAYHLGKNPELCEKLLEMTDVQAVMEVGRLSSSLGKKEETKPEAEKQLGAKESPKPIKPVTGASTKTKLPLDADGLSYAEYRRRREAGETL